MLPDAGSRFRVNHDFGFVTLDINSTVHEDSGVYMCKAINEAGEALSSISLKIRRKSTCAYFLSLTFILIDF